MSLIAELKRRNVFRVAIAYVIVAWLLMQIGDTLAPALLLPDWSTRLLAFLLILGFPLAVFFAWAFELTPDGIKKEKSVDRADSIAPVTGRKFDFLIIALLAVAVGYFAWDKFAVREATTESAASESTPVDERHSVVVLPFVNISGDPEQEYFSDGLSEELLNLLAKVPKLSVTSRTSAFFFKDKSYTIADVAEELGVSHVVEGSVRRSGDQIRVTAQLIEAVSDKHLWSNTWDRPFQDVFSIQDEIAAAVATALKIQLVDELPHVFVTDPRAYDLYLRAHELHAQETEQSMLEAEALLLELLEIDPDYPPGLVELASVSVSLGVWSYKPTDEYLERATEFARRAIDAAPNFGDGYVLLFRLAIRHQWDWALAQRIGEEGLRRDPDHIELRHVVSWLDTLRGEHEERVRTARELARLDPLAASSYWTLGHALKYAGEYEEAVVAFRKRIELSPDARAGHAALAETLLMAGRYEEALAEFNAEPWEGFTYYGRAMIYHEMGNAALSDAAMADLLGLEEANNWAAQIAKAHAVRGEKDQAFHWLDIAYELRDQGVIVAVTNPFFSNLRGDPRFEAFIEKLSSGG